MVGSYGGMGRFCILFSYFRFHLPGVSINPWSAMMKKWCTMDEWCTMNGIGWLWNDLCNWSNDWSDDWFRMVVDTALMAYGRWNMFDNFRYMIFWSIMLISQWSVMGTISSTISSTISMDSTWSSNSNGNENRQHQLYDRKRKENEQQQKKK